MFIGFQPMCGLTPYLKKWACAALSVKAMSAKDRGGHGSTGL